MFYYKINVPQRYENYKDRFNIFICTDWNNPTHEINEFISIIENKIFKHLDLFAIKSVDIIKFCEISLHQMDFTQNVCVRFYLNNLEKPNLLNKELNIINFNDDIDEKEYQLFELIICKIVQELKKSFRRFFWGIKKNSNTETLCNFCDYKKSFEEENGVHSFYDYNIGNENCCFCHPIGGDNIDGFIMQDTEL